MSWNEIALIGEGLFFLLVLIAVFVDFAVKKEALTIEKDMNRIMERDYEKWARDEAKFQDSQKIIEFEKLKNQKKRKR